MQNPALLPESCYRTRQHLSLRLDSQLSELELAVVEHHLSRCSSCKAFADDLQTMTETLRDADLVEPPFRIEVPHRPARLGGSRAGAIAAACALVAVAVGGVLGLGPDVGTGNDPGQYLQQRPSVMEHLSLVREGATPQPPAPPNGIQAAEATLVPRDAGAAGAQSQPEFGRIPPNVLSDNG